MISVEDAFRRIVGDVKPLTTEKLPLAETSGRVLAAPLRARRSQPGANMSAMDGYAVKSTDLGGKEQGVFTRVGESAAGAPFSGKLNDGETVRIFTGAVVPEGADQVVIQENATEDQGEVITREQPSPHANIRDKGQDFLERQVVLDAGTLLTPKSIGLAASAGFSHLMVYRAPKVAILSTGDELAAPDQKSFAAHETVNSTAPQLAALFKDADAAVLPPQQAGDTLADLKAAIERTREADILITIGGASVGDKDLIQQALAESGMTLDFWKVAMRPGKPLIHGHLGERHVLGLPGNPVSAFVCALLFARPLIDALMGRPAPMPVGVMLPLAASLPANGPRQHYMRAQLTGQPGSRHAAPAEDQDSSLLTVLSQSDGLIVRTPNEPPLKPGDMVPFIPF